MDSNEKELTLTPIAGKSGKAFMGTYPDGGKVFVKMNTTPILAGLAKEQIAPQLLWSRRLPDASGSYPDSFAPFTPLDDAVEKIGLYGRISAGFIEFSEQSVANRFASKQLFAICVKEFKTDCSSFSRRLCDHCSWRCTPQ